MKLDPPLLRLPRRYDADALAAEIAVLPASAWLPHPGRLVGNDAVPLITPGGAITNSFTGPMGPTEHLLACPYVMEIMADLGAVWGRSRLMGLAPAADVPEHVDVGYYWRTHFRIHIPIVTTPRVEFTCDGRTVNMAPGEAWIFDSFCLHNVRNAGHEKRIHLVLDTVGGETLWDLVEAAKADAAPAMVSPGMTATDTLHYEQVNAPEVMSPWEIRCHIDHVLALLPDTVDVGAVTARLDRFASTWFAAWTRFGTSPDGLAEYRRLLDHVRGELRQLRADRMVLPNKVPIDRALNELVFQMAVPAAPVAAPPSRIAAAA